MRAISALSSIARRKALRYERGVAFSKSSAREPGRVISAYARPHVFLARCCVMIPPLASLCRRRLESPASHRKPTREGCRGSGHVRERVRRDQMCLAPRAMRSRIQLRLRPDFRSGPAARDVPEGDRKQRQPNDEQPETVKPQAIRGQEVSVGDGFIFDYAGWCLGLSPSRRRCRPLFGLTAQSSSPGGEGMPKEPAADRCVHRGARRPACRRRFVRAARRARTARPRRAPPSASGPAAGPRVDVVGPRSERAAAPA